MLLLGGDRSEECPLGSVILPKAHYASSVNIKFIIKLVAGFITILVTVTLTYFFFVCFVLQKATVNYDAVILVTSHSFATGCIHYDEESIILLPRET